MGAETLASDGHNKSEEIQELAKLLKDGI